MKISRSFHNHVRAREQLEYRLNQLSTTLEAMHLFAAAKGWRLVLMRRSLQGVQQ